MTTKASGQDLVAIAVCTLAWGTTWFAITLQLGTVDTIVSVVYRFGLAALLLFGWLAVRGERLSLTARQHRAALGLGLFTFAIDYALVYLAEERVTSAVVAVIFATMAFLNLISFRLAYAQRAPRTAWVAAGLGALGVALLSWGELQHADMNRRAVIGLVIAFVAVVGAAVGNLFAHQSEKADAPVGVTTAWAMAYGTAMLALYALFTGRIWSFDARWPYVLALLHLAVVGSVIAFMLYYGLARRRGYASASYIAALTPIIAMTMSTLFEGKSWGAIAIAGVALVLAGQWLLLRTRKA